MRRRAAVEAEGGKIHRLRDAKSIGGSKTQPRDFVSGKNKTKATSTDTASVLRATTKKEHPPVCEMRTNKDLTKKTSTTTTTPTTRALISPKGRREVVGGTIMLVTKAKKNTTIYIA